LQQEHAFFEANDDISVFLTKTINHPGLVLGSTLEDVANSPVTRISFKESDTVSLKYDDESGRFLIVANH
jgi:hypothetical protein